MGNSYISVKTWQQVMMLGQLETKITRIEAADKPEGVIAIYEWADNFINGDEIIENGTVLVEGNKNCSCGSFQYD